MCGGRAFSSLTMKDLIQKMTERGLISFGKARGRGRPPSKSELFRAVHAAVKELGISEACRRHGVSRQGYYYWVRKNHG